MPTKKSAGRKGAPQTPKRPGPKGARKAAPKARKAPASKAPAKGRRQASPARRPARRKAAPRPPASLPRHVPHNARPAIKERARAAGVPVAEAELPLDAERQEELQDPRIAAGDNGIGTGAVIQPENYGQFKNKAPARNDKPVNWFRRAAKPKQ